jgi:hypothetical protein
MALSDIGGYAGRNLTVGELAMPLTLCGEAAAGTQ